MLRPTQVDRLEVEVLVRVVFDAYWWVEGPAALRHVLREIVLAWRKEFPGDEIALVVRRRHLEAARASTPAGVGVFPSMLRPQALLAAAATERVRRRLGYDAVIVQNFAASSRATSAVYLHDVMFVTNPEWFTRLERAYFSWMVRWAPRADVVFASTSSEAQRIRTHTKSRSVVPVGLGLSTELVDAGATREVPGLVPGEFLLTVGRLNVRKNLVRTIVGSLASGEVSRTRPLVVVGGVGGKSQALDPRVQEAVDDGRVRFLGHVEEAQLRWLYQHTALFLFLSLGEGFGMPPVEALYFGARVLTSDLPVFRENLPLGTTFVDPLDDEAIAAGVRAVLTSSADQGKVSSTVIAERHDWRASVQRMRSALVPISLRGEDRSGSRGHQ